MELLDDLRIRIRRWLGVSQFQKSTRNRLMDLEKNMAVSQEDIERLNAATSRIASRVASLLDQIDALGSGNDDVVRSEQQLADVAQASADLRPVIEQLEALGADASNVVPEPTPEQVPVEPGPDVAPVENAGGAGDGTVVTDPAPAPGESPADTVTAPDTDPAAPAGNLDGDVAFDDSGLAVDGDVVVEPVDGGAVPTTDASGDAVAPGAPTDGTVVGEGASASQPGPSGDDATVTNPNT